MSHYECKECHQRFDECRCDMAVPVKVETPPPAPPPAPKGTYTGGSADYYSVKIVSTTTPYALPYTAECNDIIEALGMNFAEGNAFKALWRRAAQRTLGLRKAGAKDDGLYDAEKVEFFGKRLVEQSKLGSS